MNTSPTEGTAPSDRLPAPDATAPVTGGPERLAVPTEECDVVMKGGITSGVVYPKALAAIGSHYRIRGIGGASAGAIGAALGAAAEFGRATGGFRQLETLANELGDGKLAALFQPQKATKPLFGMMLAATGSDRPGPARTGFARVRSVIASLLKGFPVASVVGAALGIALLVIGATSGGLSGWLLVVAGLLLAVVGAAAAITLRLMSKMTVAVPENLFGICRGLGADDANPGFTDWLSSRIDGVAGLEAEHRPLRFGQLWTGTTEVALRHEQDRGVDLRMITTCLSEGRPYEMPWEAKRFFFDPATWRTLFPGPVVDALEQAPPAKAPSDRDDRQWRWEESIAVVDGVKLRRLPDAEHLPVIVATRLSLSFPLLISAVPLWTIDRRDQATQEATDQFRAAEKAGTAPPTSGLQFTKEWFTDGGFCSNFPVHLFDAALASRPTFAINLGRFSGRRGPDSDQTKNVEWARDNRPILPTSTPIPERGFGAVAGFGSAAVNTARNWQDGSHLDHPGFRDRIVRVLQTKQEGGMNLFMEGPTIEGLAERGKAAGEVMVDQFTKPHYRETFTGWDNHRWVRFRALLSVLPDWLGSYASGRAVLGVDPTAPPSYDLSARGSDLAAKLVEGLDQLATTVRTADPKAVADLEEQPRPLGAIRRIPQI